MIRLEPLEVQETGFFTEQIGEYFPRTERGPDGELSKNDFVRFEFNPIKDVIATDFFELPELIPGRPEYRVVTVLGVFVPLFIITAQLNEQPELVELINLIVDFDPPESFFIE